MAITISFRILINENTNAIQVYTPYHPEFTKAMHSLGGTWDKASGCWWAGISQLEAVRAAMRVSFGADDVTGQIDLKLTFLEDKGQLTDDYRLLGKTICHATSRNSGGTAGYDVTFLSGKPESGGSVKNWLSIIPKGSVVILRNVNRKYLNPGTAVPKGIKVAFHYDASEQQNGLYHSLTDAIEKAYRVVQNGRFRKTSLQDKAYTSALEESAGQIAFLLEEIKKKH